MPLGQYLFDGGQSRAIRSSLQAIVDENKVASAASFAVALYRMRGDNFVILASSGNRPDHFSENEPIAADRFPRGSRPTQVEGLTLRSLVRNRSLELQSAIVIPFRDEFGYGGVIVGDPTSSTSHASAEAIKESLTIANIVRTARNAGAFRLERDLRAALGDIAAANATIFDPELRLQATLQSGKSLFGCDVAYLATPEPGQGAFTFSQTLGIHTRNFKALRVEEGHGLGGLARKLRKPVRSFDYFNDDRLRSAPVAETRREGIISAMAAPVVLRNEVAAVIYMGERRLRAFTPTDEAMLEDFAGFATLAIEQNTMDSYRHKVTLRNAREEMAYALHDTVVRRLIEIGFVIEENRNNNAPSSSPHHFNVIAHAVESAMDALRVQISDVFAQEDPVREIDAWEVMNRIMELRHAPGIARTHGENADLRCANIAAESTNALIRVGQEAIVNAERHSGCRNIHVQLDTDRKTATLTIQDDGRGMSSDEPHRAERSGGAHLGIRGMQEAVNSVAGVPRFDSPTGGGLIVTAQVQRLNPGEAP